MTRREQQRRLPVSEQAAEWLVALDDGGLNSNEKAAFLTWLKQSPLHIREFLQLSALHVELAQNAQPETDIAVLVAAAKADVIDLASEQPAESETKPPKRRRRWWQAAAVLVIGVTLASGWWLGGRGPGETVYATDIGEQRSIVLDDGSVILLNTLSEVRVNYDADRRSVQLRHGEALFDVAKSATRPFIVDAGAMQLEVLGTRFNIYRQADETVLTVVEGEVAVSTAAKTSMGRSGSSIIIDEAEPLTATAGQQVTVANKSGAISRLAVLEAAPATAWTERKLVFNAVPLIDVAEEFNRYNRRPMWIEDDALADRPITGVFKAHDADLLAAFLANQPGIVVEQRGDGIHVRAATDAQ